jgi:hypothetical protein
MSAKRIPCEKPVVRLSLSFCALHTVPALPRRLAKRGPSPPSSLRRSTLHLVPAFSPFAVSTGGQREPTHTYPGQQARSNPLTHISRIEPKARRLGGGVRAEELSLRLGTERCRRAGLGLGIWGPE